MSLRLPAYPDTKDTGVEWLGQIPAHWRMVRTKFLFDERVEKGFPDEPLLAATQTKGVVPKEHYESRTVTAQKDFHLLKLVKEGDFVISLRSFQGGIEYAHYRGIISPAYTILKPSLRTAVTRDYFEFFFKSQIFISSLTLFVTGIREGQNIEYGRLSRASLPLPPAQEQQAIGRFLRHLTAKTNRLVRDKRRLIALLTEQKQAVIHHAVTKGLNPDAPMKPSGVEWLGDIPAHWEVRRIKSLANVRLSNVDKLSVEGEPDVFLCNYTDVYRNDKITAALPFMRATATKEQIVKFRLRVGDVLITKDSETASDIAVPAFVAEELPPNVVCGYHLAHLRPKRMTNGAYLRYSFLSSRLREQFYVAANGVTRYGLSYNAINTALFLMPPLTEQAEVVAHIDKETTTVDTAISRTLREIDLIREYRTRLISDVVTGKLDVRDAVLPDVFPGAGDAAEERLDIDETYAEPDDDAGEGEAGEEITDDADE